jgi:hypothetical protein
MEAVTIHPPEGYELCPTSTQTEIRFRPIVKSKPKWEDFGTVSGFFIRNMGEVVEYTGGHKSDPINRNTWPTKEEAEACLALSQLCQWRDKYNEGWKPAKDNEFKHTIGIGGTDNIFRALSNKAVLSFKTAEIRDKFLEDFEPLIEIAKPLL